MLPKFFRKPFLRQTFSLQIFVALGRLYFPQPSCHRPVDRKVCTWKLVFMFQVSNFSTLTCYNKLPETLVWFYAYLLCLLWHNKFVFVTSIKYECNFISIVEKNRKLFPKFSTNQNVRRCTYTKNFVGEHRHIGLHKRVLVSNTCLSVCGFASTLYLE